MTGTPNRSIEAPDWSTIPAPIDDGAARHLQGMAVPSIPLMATDGATVNLALLAGRTVVYAYPRNGLPEIPNPEGWEDIPGARGCTPQTCAFRDNFLGLRAMGVQQLFGLSTQDTEYQREFVDRLQLPFQILSDQRLKLTTALHLPTFQTHGMTLLKRLTLVIENGRIVKVFYPVFPPDQNPAEVLAWLEERGKR